MSPESSVSILKSLATLEVPCLLGVSRASSKESRRTYLFLTIFNGVLHVRNAVCMSLESSVSILKSLATLEVPRLLGVSRASSKESRRICFVPDCSQWCITSPPKCLFDLLVGRVSGWFDLGLFDLGIFDLGSGIPV